MKYFKIIILVALALPLIAFAQTTPPGFLDSLSCVTDGDCQLADVATGFILLTKLLLGAMGAVALLYFVIGGFQWMTSQGNQEKVRKGQQTMTNTVIALFIAFTSYLLLNFFVNNILGVKSDYMIGDALAQCDGKSDGTACNVVAGSTSINPYECFSEECVTKCKVKANMTSLNWQCYTVPNPELISTDTTYYERNLCPGDEHTVCTLLNASGEPADPAYQAFLHRFVP